jgi:hypothetical protein
MNMLDPDHSEGELRFLVLGMSQASRLVVVSYAERPPRTRIPRVKRDGNMKTTKRKKPAADADTMHPEYDFSNAVRGVTAARYAQGTNVVLLDPDVAQLFPHSRAVNEALRTFARLGRVTLRKTRPKRTA